MYCRYQDNSNCGNSPKGSELDNCVNSVSIEADNWWQEIAISACKHMLQVTHNIMLTILHDTDIEFVPSTELWTETMADGLHPFQIKFQGSHIDKTCHVAPGNGYQKISQQGINQLLALTSRAMALCKLPRSWRGEDLPVSPSRDPLLMRLGQLLQWVTTTPTRTDYAHTVAMLISLRIST